MKNVVFLFDNEWALGSIHYELFKYLWKYNYNCNLLPWNKLYSDKEIQELDSHIDFWVTSPHGYMGLKYKHHIRPDRCIVIGYATLDLTEYQYRYGLEDFNLVRNFGVCSNYLKDYSKTLNLNREPVVCNIGINYNTFYNEPSKDLRVVGFAGAYHERHEFTKEMVDGPLSQPRYKKRGYLVKEAAHLAGLHFTAACHYHNSFVTMPGYYKSVDCVIISSSEEGGGLPLLESGAAGKLVIGTPVGWWNDMVGTSGGIEVPIDEKEFIENTVNTLLHYKNRSSEYRDKCFSIREHAKTYDWENHIEQWLSILK